MADLDIGSLVVMEHGDLVGMLTFREVIQAVVANGGIRHASRALGDGRRAAHVHARDRHQRGAPHDAGSAMRATCRCWTTARMGVISFYDVAKTVVDAQDFENRMRLASRRHAAAATDPKPPRPRQEVEG